MKREIHVSLVLWARGFPKAPGGPTGRLETTLGLEGAGAKRCYSRGTK